MQNYCKIGRPAGDSALFSDGNVRSNDAIIFEIWNDQGKKVTNCIHKNKAHYAKGMCNYCYHKYGRSKKASACPHTDKGVYAKGQCHLCYHYKLQKKAQALKKQKEREALAKPSFKSTTVTKDNREVITFHLEAGSSSEEE